MRLSFIRRSSGFSLIEVLVSISIFAAMTLGITPLLISSMRGSALARSFTVGKNLTQEAMERARGLPYFDGAPNRDLLDLYFPNLSTGYSAGTVTFTTTCTPTTATPAASGARACPPKHADGTSKIPTGFTITYAAQFLTPVANTNPETFTSVTPGATYSSAAEATSTPPSDLMKLTVTTSWTQLGRSRSFALTTYMGERKLSPDRVRAEATIDYSVQVLTSYKETNGRLSKLSGFAGRSVSDIEIRNFAAASVEENAGEFTLTQQEFGTTPGSDLDKVNGAATALRAPPNQAPTTTSVARDVVTHPSLGNIEVGAVGAGTVNNPTPTTPTVAITNSLPKAVGNFGFVGGVGTDIFWANNQADTASDALLHLDPGRPVFSVLHQPSSQTVTDLLGSTFAEATTTGDANRKVEGTVHVEIPQISLLPTTFAPDGVVLITNFVANLTCKSTGTLSSSAVTGSWSGNVKYWADSNNLDGSNAGAYVSVTNGGSTTLLSGSTSTSPAATDALAPLKTSNPLVYDSPVPLSDIYLFQDDTSLIPKKGYLTSWTGAFTLPSSLVKDNARVEIPTAMRLATARTNLSNEETQLAVDIAKLSCQSADRRG